MSQTVVSCLFQTHRNCPDFTLTNVETIQWIHAQKCLNGTVNSGPLSVVHTAGKCLDGSLNISSGFTITSLETISGFTLTVLSSGVLFVTNTAGKCHNVSLKDQMVSHFQMFGFIQWFHSYCVETPSQTVVSCLPSPAVPPPPDRKRQLKHVA